MAATPIELARSMYHRKFDAVIHPSYTRWRTITAPDGKLLAVLGLREAAAEPLFLEHYLTAPVEQVVSDKLGISAERHEIVEIGCLAAVNGRAMVELWRSCAQALSASHRVAVATPTRTLRAMLERVGIPIAELSPAHAEALPPSSEDWGHYYEERPMVCAGLIGAGLAGLTDFPLQKESRA